jgi:flagellin-like hook-associated protein FlgL
MSSLKTQVSNALSTYNTKLKGHASASTQIRSGRKNLNIINELTTMSMRSNVDTNNQLKRNNNFVYNTLKTAKHAVDSLAKNAREMKTLYIKAHSGLYKRADVEIMQGSMTSLKSQIKATMTNTKFAGIDIFKDVDYKIRASSTDKIKMEVHIPDYHGGKIFRGKLADAVNQVIRDKPGDFFSGDELKNFAKKDRENYNFATDPTFNERKIAKLLFTLQTSNPKILTDFSKTEQGKIINIKLGKNITTATEMEIKTAFSFDTGKYLYTARYIESALKDGILTEKQIADTILDKNLLSICCHHTPIPSLMHKQVDQRIRFIIDESIQQYKQLKSTLPRKETITQTVQFMKRRHATGTMFHLLEDWHITQNTRLIRSTQTFNSEMTTSQLQLNHKGKMTNAEALKFSTDAANEYVRNPPNYINSTGLNAVSTYKNPISGAVQNFATMSEDQKELFLTIDMRTAAARKITDDILRVHQASPTNSAEVSKIEKDLETLDAFCERLEDNAPTNLVGKSTDPAEWNKEAKWAQDLTEEVVSNIFNKMTMLQSKIIMQMKQIESIAESLDNQNANLTQAIKSIEDVNYLKLASECSEYLMSMNSAIGVISSVNKVMDRIAEASQDTIKNASGKN